METPRAAGHSVLAICRMLAGLNKRLCRRSLRRIRRGDSRGRRRPPVPAPPPVIPSRTMDEILEETRQILRDAGLNLNAPLPPLPPLKVSGRRRPPGRRGGPRAKSE